MTNIITRVFDYLGSGCWTTEEVTVGGGGGSQNLAQVLAQGGDPDGNPITGALAVQVVAPASDIFVASESNFDWGFSVKSFAGIFTQVGPGADYALRLEDADRNVVFEVGPSGAVTISPSNAVPGDYTEVLSIKDASGDLLVALDSAGEASFYGRDDGANVLSVIGSATGTADIFQVQIPPGNALFKVGPTGAVTISPHDGEAGANPLTVQASDSSNEVFKILASGELISQPGGGGIVLDINTDSIGFYGTAAIAQQTGVPITAAGIHAALVNLGLITA